MSFASPLKNHFTKVANETAADQKKHDKQMARIATLVDQLNADLKNMGFKTYEPPQPPVKKWGRFLRNKRAEAQYQQAQALENCHQQTNVMQFRADDKGYTWVVRGRMGERGSNLLTIHLGLYKRFYKGLNPSLHASSSAFYAHYSLSGANPTISTYDGTGPLDLNSKESEKAFKFIAAWLMKNTSLEIPYTLRTEKKATRGGKPTA